MIRRYKIIFGKDFEIKKSIESVNTTIPLFLYGMSKEDTEKYFEKIKQENPKRFEILKKYIDKFESKNNGLHG
jgi:hypothetical protein